MPSAYLFCIFKLKSDSACTSTTGTEPERKTLATKSGLSKLWVVLHSINYYLHLDVYNKYNNIMLLDTVSAIFVITVVSWKYAHPSCTILRGTSAGWAIRPTTHANYSSPPATAPDDVQPRCAWRILRSRSPSRNRHYLLVLFRRRNGRIVCKPDNCIVIVLRSVEKDWYLHFRGQADTYS